MVARSDAHTTSDAHPGFTGSFSGYRGALVAGLCIFIAGPWITAHKARKGPPRHATTKAAATATASREHGARRGPEAPRHPSFPGFVSSLDVERRPPPYDNAHPSKEACTALVSLPWGTEAWRR